MHVIDVHRFAARVKKVSDVPFLDVRRLLAWACDQEVASIGVQAVLNDAQYQIFQHAFNRLCMGEPLAYITELWSFWDMDVKVVPGVLIPRSDTECLVEAVLEHTSTSCKESQDVLDLGTGSGVVALALAKERPLWRIMGIDANVDAVHIACENKKKYEKRSKNVCFQHMDWAQLPENKKWDVWVSNPPYIEEGDVHVQDRVHQWEPASALYAKDQGLFCIRQIIDLAKTRIRPGGLLAFEHGFLQADMISAALYDVGCSRVVTKNDHRHLPRVTVGFWSGDA